MRFKYGGQYITDCMRGMFPIWVIQIWIYEIGHIDRCSMSIRRNNWLPCPLPPTIQVFRHSPFMGGDNSPIQREKQVAEL